MIYKIFNILVYVLSHIVVTLAAEFFSTATIQTQVVAELTTHSRSCICVPYWQCAEDFSGLLDDGSDIIDIRMSQPPTNTETCSGDFDVCCQVQCGKLNNGFSKKDQVASRILKDGNDADFAEFPWMLGILDEEVFKCGASLIHPQVAITAAHCVSKNNTYTIRAGEGDWAAQDEPLPHQDRRTKEIIIHPHYHSASLKNDIAILVLDEPFKLSENVGVVCLPRHADNIDNTQCTASGWGKNSFKKGSYQTTLKKVTLPIVPRTNCLRSLRNARLGPYFQLHKSFICAGGEKNRDTCKGDGGSPLICPMQDESDRFQQVGIVSWGLTCGLHDTPGVYVNVALFSDWIDEVLALRHFDIFVYRK